MIKFGETASNLLPDVDFRVFQVSLDRGIGNILGQQRSVTAAVDILMGAIL